MPFKNALIQFLKLFNADGTLAMRLGKFRNKDGNVGPIIQFYPESGLFNAAEILAYVAGGRDILSFVSPSKDGTWSLIEIRSSDGTGSGYPHGSEMVFYADNVYFQALQAAAMHYHVEGNMDVNGTFAATSVTSGGDVNVGGTVVNSANPNWIAPTLGNLWTNYGAGGYDTAAYCQMADGTVMIKGLIKAGTVGPGAVFTLPVGMRPSANRLFTGNASGGIADIRVFASGAVCVYALFAGATNASVSLDCVVFRP